jgi:hypothetical protein
MLDHATTDRAAAQRLPPSKTVQNKTLTRGCYAHRQRKTQSKHMHAWKEETCIELAQNRAPVARIRLQNPSPDRCLAATALQRLHHTTPVRVQKYDCI